MSRQNVLISFATLLVLTSCSAASVDMETPSLAETQPMLKPVQGYAKPGLAVSFFHDYDGITKPGEIETINITVKDGLQDGTLTLKFVEDETLNVKMNNTTRTFRMEGDDDHVVSVQVSSKSLGLHYLNFTAIINAGQGQVSTRNFNIPFNVNTENQMPAKAPFKVNATQDGQKTELGTDLIVMDAEETIEQD